MPSFFVVLFEKNQLEIFDEMNIITIKIINMQKFSIG